MARPVVVKAKTNNAQSLAQAFKDVNLHVFADIARIKKPSKAALVTGQLLSSFVLLMRDAFNPRAIPNVDILDWPSIIQLVTGNLTKFTLEIQGIRTKLAESMPCNTQVLEQLRGLRTLYFPDEQSYYTLLNQVADRNLKVVITMVFGVLVNFLKLDATHVSTKPRDNSIVKSPNTRSLTRSNFLSQRAKSPLPPGPARPA